MLIYFGTLQKEINSTIQPDIDTFVTRDCQLKENVSLLNPMIKLHDNDYDTSWNYAYIPKWDRYYFLHDAVMTTGLIWEVELAIDVLASWKSAITETSAYVSRSASHYDNKLPDSTWSHTTDNTITTSEIDVGLDAGGCFLLFTASNDNNSSAIGVPALSVYALTGFQLKSVCNYLFTSDFFNTATEGLDEASKVLSKQFFNPFQYIVKCMWLPLPVSAVSSNTTKINFGWWTYSDGPDVGLVGLHYITKTFSINTGTYSTWIDRDPAWTHQTIYVPGFGQMDISSDHIGRTLSGKIIIDLATGSAGLFITASDGQLVASATGSLGADIQLSSLYEDIIGDLGSKPLSTITAKATAVGGAIANTFSGIKDMFTGKTDLSLSNVGSLAKDAVVGVQAALQPTMSTIGANGTRAINEVQNKAILTTTKYARYTDITERLGGMCNKIYTLSALSGYTEVVNPHVRCNATSSEITMINAFLSGGFYLE